MKNNQKAFSLIELSIVLIIIALLVAGVIAGQKLISLSKISAARTMTNSAPVTGIDGLSLWVESTSKKSFKNSQGINNTAIDTWYDINPLSTSKNNLTQGTSNNKPIYQDDKINGLPAVSFDGLDTSAGDRLAFNGDFLVGTNYTLFFVTNLAEGSAGGLFMGGSGSSNFTNLTLGHFPSPQSMIHTHFIESYSASIPTKASIHVFTFSTTDDKKYYNNGTNLFNGTAGTTALTSFANPVIGCWGGVNNCYQGYIGEVIMFTRVLTDSERENVEEYLSKKWKISLL